LREQITRLNEQVLRNSVKIEETVRLIDRKIVAANIAEQEKQRLQSHRAELEKERKDLQDTVKDLNGLERAGRKLAVEQRTTPVDTAGDPSLKSVLSVLAVVLQVSGDSEESAKRSENALTGALGAAPSGLGVGQHAVTARHAPEDLGLSQNDVQELEPLRERVSSYAREQLGNVPVRPVGDTDRLQPSGARERLGGVNQVEQALNADFAAYMRQRQDPRSINVQGLIDYVMREQYLETNRDLYFYAQKVKFFNDVKKLYRDEISRITGLRSKLAPHVDVSTTKVKTADTGHDNVTSVQAGLSTIRVYDSVPGSDGKPRQLTQNEISDDSLKTLQYQSLTTTSNVLDKMESTIKALEAKLSSVGDDAQLANVDLQNMVQKQTQLVQLISNLSKAWYEIARGVISKIGG
jgi:hypothetical protein